MIATPGERTFTIVAHVPHFNNRRLNWQGAVYDFRGYKKLGLDIETCPSSKVSVPLLPGEFPLLEFYTTRRHNNLTGSYLFQTYVMEAEALAYVSEYHRIVAALNNTRVVSVRYFRQVLYSFLRSKFAEKNPGMDEEFEANVCTFRGEFDHDDGRIFRYDPSMLKPENFPVKEPPTKKAAPSQQKSGGGKPGRRPRSKPQKEEEEEVPPAQEEQEEAPQEDLPSHGVEGVDFQLFVQPMEIDEDEEDSLRASDLSSPDQESDSELPIYDEEVELDDLPEFLL
jgi:hypothetical protein